jgi:hypothetical protein
MRLCLGIPTVSDIPWEAFQSHLITASDITQEGWDIVCPQVHGVYPYARARDIMFQKAIEYECDRILFLDQDMVPPPKFFSRLNNVMNRTKAVITTAYTQKRGFPYSSVWYKYDPEGNIRPVVCPDRPVVHNIDRCGMACTLIDLDWVQENLESPWFPTEIDDRGYLEPEDMVFCEKVRGLMGEIVGVPSIRVGHLTSRVSVCDNNDDLLRKEYLRIQREGSKQSAKEEAIA